MQDEEGVGTSTSAILTRNIAETNEFARQMTTFSDDLTRLYATAVGSEARPP